MQEYSRHWAPSLADQLGERYVHENLVQHLGTVMEGEPCRIVALQTSRQ